MIVCQTEHVFSGNGLVPITPKRVIDLLQFSHFANTLHRYADPLRQVFDRYVMLSHERGKVKRVKGWIWSLFGVSLTGGDGLSYGGETVASSLDSAKLAGVKIVVENHVKPVQTQYFTFCPTQ
jgi:hypothetical protein